MFRSELSQKKPSSHTYRLRALCGDIAAFEQIGDIYKSTIESQCKSAFVDCSRIKWIDAHLSAGFFAAQQLLKERGISLHFTNLIPRVAEIFEHHGLLGDRPARVKESVIPLTQFQPGESKEFAQYTQDNFCRLPIPEMSNEVSDKFFEGIDELFSNAELHSKTTHGMFSCGQFFPRKNKLDFTLVDTGLGFQGLINRVKHKNLAPDTAIDWAMTGNNTTRSGDIPGGLGLKILKGFVELNQGSLTIVSHNGHWQLCRGHVTMGTMKSPFPGTAVTLEINTADKNKYYMAKVPT